MPGVGLDRSRRMRGSLVGVGVGVRHLAALASLAVAACTNEATPHPATLGGCSGSYDASCSIFTGGGVSGGSTDSGADSGNIEVVDSAVFPEDSAVCSSTDFLLAARAPLCATCLVAPLNDGAPSCCALDTTCGIDPGCSRILQCVLSCTNPGACSQTCGNGADPQSANAYRNLVACVQYGCAPFCPVLVPLVPLPTDQ